MSRKKAVYIAAGIVIPLTILYYQSLPSIDFLRTAVLFFILFPGMAAQMLIAGPHGGTIVQNAAATVVGAGINIACYSLLVLGTNKVVRKIT